MDIGDVIGTAYRDAIDDVREAGHDAKHEALASYLVEYGRMAVGDADDPKTERFEGMLDYIETIDDPAERYGAAESWWWAAFNEFDEYGFRDDDGTGGPDAGEHVPYDEIRHILDGSADVTVTLDGGRGIDIDVSGTVTHEHVYPEGTPEYEPSGPGGPEGAGEEEGPEEPGGGPEGPESEGPEEGREEPEGVGPEAEGPESEGPETTGPEDVGPEEGTPVYEVESTIFNSDADWYGGGELPDDAEISYGISAEKYTEDGRKTRFKSGDLQEFYVQFGKIDEDVRRPRGPKHFDEVTFDRTYDLSDVDEDVRAWDAIFDMPDDVPVDEAGEYGLFVGARDEHGQLWKEKDLTTFTLGDTESSKGAESVEMELERWHVGEEDDEDGIPSGLGELADVFRNDVLGGSADLQYAVKLSGDDQEAVEDYLEHHFAGMRVEGAPITDETRYVNGQPLVSEDEYGTPDILGRDSIDAIEWDDAGNAYLLGGYQVRDERYAGLRGKIENALSDAGAPAAKLRVTMDDDLEEGPGVATKSFEEDPGQTLFDYLSNDVGGFLHGLDTNDFLFGTSPGTHTIEDHDDTVYERFRAHHKEDEGAATKVINKGSSWFRDLGAAAIADRFWKSMKS